MKAKPRCFVIMPFGDKPDASGSILHFDTVYDSLIRPTVEALDIECIRCDRISEAGAIPVMMHTHIYECEVAVVDLTLHNANVLYELGVRHALADSVTVLLQRKGDKIPFNIQSCQIIPYGSVTNKKHAASVREKIAAFIQNGLKRKKKDSPVYDSLNLKVVREPKIIKTQTIYPYALAGLPSKKICLITGDIRDVHDVDVWVSSENTNMIMARHYDRSISSIIRYCGAKKARGRIVKDIIANELAIAAPGDPADIPVGEIVVTGSGELQRTHGVKRIFHAAAAIGQLGTGFSPIDDIGRCVRNALITANAKKYARCKFRSILFPLMGTGTTRGDLQQKAKELIDAAIGHLQGDPKCCIDCVYFLTWSEKDLEVCQHILQNSAQVELSS